MASRKKVLIIGGGPAGLLAALRFTLYNAMEAVVYEVRSEPSTLGGAIGIPSNGLKMLARLGLYDALAARGCLTPEMVVHSVDGNQLGKYAMVSWSERKTGFSYLRIQRTDIMDVLLDAIKKAGIPIVFGKVLERIQEDDKSISAIFSDGSIDSADLLLGADGIHSTVRKLYVEPSVKPKYMGMSNVFALIPTNRLPKDASRLSAFYPTPTKNGLFAISPCTADGQMLYWFFSREIPIPASGDNRDGWEHHKTKEVEEVKSTILELLGRSGSVWTTMLKDTVTSTEVVRFYPIHHIPPGIKWHRGRCLIIGDAAHAMPPHASQGLSMASEDVIMLSKLFKDFHNASSEKIFGMYEEKRRPRVEKFLTTAQRNGTVRQEMSSVRLRLFEYAIWAGLGLHNAFGMEKFGINQKELVYDPEEEEFSCN